MSPRAACRLEKFGFGEVYEYAAGIADWIAAGLRFDGTEDPGLRAADGLHALVAAMEKRKTRLVVVSDPQGVLIGVVLRADAARLASGEAPEQVWRDCDGCQGRWVRTSSGR